MAEPSGAPRGVITIKKYANRRLYNTATSSYVTLEHLSRMVKNQVDFIVLDAKTSADLTRQVLTQIISEEENKGENLLPIKFLRQIIGLYGQGLQGLVPRYLDLTMDSFARNQQQIRQHMEETLSGLFPFGDKGHDVDFGDKTYDVAAGERPNDAGMRNMAMLEDAMRMFSPAPQAQSYRHGDGAPVSDMIVKRPSESVETRELRAKLDNLQEQLDRLLTSAHSDPKNN